MKEIIGILFGGESSEYEVSCVSAANVAEHIDRERYEVITIGITRDGKWWIYSGPTEWMKNNTWYTKKSYLLPAVLSPCKAHHGLIVLNKEAGAYSIQRIDTIFPVLHGKNGEDGTMQGLLALSGIPFVGCDTCASAMCMDKDVTKRICESAGIGVVPFITAKRGCDTEALADKCEESFGFPLFVKPANAGSSVGISKCGDRQSLLEGIEEAFRHDRKILVEPAVVGREIEVAVCGNEKPIASDCGEIVPNSEFYDYETKYVNDRSQLLAPAPLDDATNNKIRAVALEVYRAMGCSGLSRVDFFLTENSVLFNEINTIPGFTQISMYPKLMECIGISYRDLITRLILLAQDGSR